MGNIYKGDIGTRLRTTLNVDLVGYDTIDYNIKKPSGIIVTKPCEIEDEANGIIYYDVISGDLNEVGSYALQANIIFNSGNKNFSVTKTFIVHGEYK